MNSFLLRIAIALSLCFANLLVAPSVWSQESPGKSKDRLAGKKPKAVIVVGTHHYSPQITMPKLARELEAVGFDVVLVAGKENPERKPAGIKGLESLKHADVAIFYMRFLTLPDDQLKLIDDYVQSGRPVVGFRTSTHAFIYPSGSKNAVRNNGFGKDVLGSRYFVHLQGKTRVAPSPAAGKHPILEGLDFSKPIEAAGTLYLSDIPKDATSILLGTGNSRKTGLVKNQFGEHQLQKTMTDDVAWTWENAWGGRVFTTTLGHKDSFDQPTLMQFFVQGVSWAAAHQPSDASPAKAQKSRKTPKPQRPDRKVNDARNMSTGEKAPFEDPDFRRFGIYRNTAPRAESIAPRKTQLPLELSEAARIAFVGNTLLDRAQHFGYFESMLYHAFPNRKLRVRNLSWSADTPDLMPRPDNFADVIQHLTHERADVIFAAFGFNESFNGPQGVQAFKTALAAFVGDIKSRAFNGKTAPQVVLVSPIANENTAAVPAADMNNQNIKLYAEAMRSVAEQEGVAFVDVFAGTADAIEASSNPLTINGCHLNEEGYESLASILFRSTFDMTGPKVNETLRQAVVDKNVQYFYRYRPLNTFYYVGGRSKSYGYLDFLPAMKNFDLMVDNRERRIWRLADGEPAPEVDDSNLPQLPKTKASRGANQWMSAADELKAFEIDDRFEVNLFAGEEEFPDMAAPIQMRWDAKGRLWVACSTTYPHVYPGNKPNDKLVILEDTDGDGRADRSRVFADDLHIPLSFEFGDGGVYVSEEPHLTFIKDTDGDGRADYRRRVLTGFGTEDSHHSLHDFAWSPDGDLVFRESIFHHSQVETPYGPVRQQNSGWFRYTPRNEKLVSFGTYHSTNPWGVTYDDWGQHVASHPIFAEAHHALDPPYPVQHPKPNGLRAYSGTCGHEFVDMASFPDELQGGFIKARYKPTNRIEMHRWVESEFGYDEEYLGDIIFSTNLSFIPVDLRYGPRGAMYVCDWYNPIKGHAQYSLRDERRDRHSGRIWRITAKDKPLVQPPKFAGVPLSDLLDILKRPEYRYRYWAKREIRLHDPLTVAKALDSWVAKLDKSDPRFRHHQLEAVWVYRSVDAPRPDLLRELLEAEDHHPRAAAVHQLRFWHESLDDWAALLLKASQDSSGIVRMQAAITCSYIDHPAAFQALRNVLALPREGHLNYAVRCALGSKTMRKFWEDDSQLDIARLLRKADRDNTLREPTPSAKESAFDSQSGVKKVEIGCLPERMKFTQERFIVTVGQPVKVVFKNPDATDHNLLIVQPDALSEVGMAANAMAKDPKNASSDFIPGEKKHLILQATRMIGPTRKSRVHVLRFNAPDEPGIYPYVCTFPGHWVVMKGQMVVARNDAEAQQLIAAAQPKVVRKWKMSDFGTLGISNDQQTIMRGMNAFVKASCNQCHVVAGHGVALGPDLTTVGQRYRDRKLLQQLIDPSSEIHKDYQTYKVLTTDGDLVTGLIKSAGNREIVMVPNLLTPKVTRKIPAGDVEFKAASKVSSMPTGLIDVLTETEIMELLSYLQSEK